MYTISSMYTVYTVKEIAEKLIISEESVRRWCREGKIEAKYMSRKGGYVIWQKAIEEFLKGNQKYKTIWIARGGHIYGE